MSLQKTKKADGETNAAREMVKQEKELLETSEASGEKRQLKVKSLKIQADPAEGRDD